MKTVIIPHENEKDLQEIDQTVRRALNFLLVDHADAVLDAALVRPVQEEPAVRKTTERVLPVAQHDHGPAESGDPPMMNLQRVEFVKSAAQAGAFLHDGLPQIAFAGKSNVANPPC